MRPEDTAMASGEGKSSHEDIGPAADVNYQRWREMWDLDDYTPRQIYEAGFIHGYEAAMNDKGKE